MPTIPHIVTASIACLRYSRRPTADETALTRKAPTPSKWTRSRSTTSPTGSESSPTSGATEGAAPRGSDVERERSEEHTSELQSQFHLVCRLLLGKKKT